MLEDSGDGGGREPIRRGETSPSPKRPAIPNADPSWIAVTPWLSVQRVGGGWRTNVGRGCEALRSVVMSV